MLKKTIYPKTTRLGKDTSGVLITEKLDGANLSFLKRHDDDELYIAQRNIIFTLEELLSDDKVIEQKLYKNLKPWLAEHGEDLKARLNNGSAICGEWLGMGGKINYKERLDKLFYMYAKANVKEDFGLYNIYYDHTLFNYPFVDQEFPTYIGRVPAIEALSEFPTVEKMDYLYKVYVKQLNTYHDTEQRVEGFCVTDGETIRKYVRLKNGKLTEHTV